MPRGPWWNGMGNLARGARSEHDEESNARQAMVVVFLGAIVPSQSLTSVAAMKCLVASAPEKGQARPRRRDCEVIANRAEPGKIQKLEEVCHGQTEKVYFRAVAEQQPEPSTAQETAAAVRRRLGRVDRRAPQRGRHRCWQSKSLCVRTTGAGSDAGAGVRKLDGGFAQHGGMVEILRHHHRSDAIHRRVLDCDLRSTGAGGIRGIPGECARDQESAGTQERRTRVPVAEEVTYLWAAAQIVSAAGADPRGAHVVATAEPGSGRL